MDVKPINPGVQLNRNTRVTDSRADQEIQAYGTHYRVHKDLTFNPFLCDLYPVTLFTN
jgi:hypothetical protein